MAKSSRRPPKRSRPPSFFQTLVADAALTALLPLLTTCFLEVAGWVNPDVVTPEAAFIALIIAMLMALGPLGRALGGGMFNPCDLASSYAVGKASGRDLVLRSVAQTLGAVGGAYAALALLPPSWAEHGLDQVAVLKPGVDMVQGASCEFLLSYLLTFAFLASQHIRFSLLRYWLPLMGVVVALVAGARFSGPVLNPATALSWTLLHWPLEEGYIVQHAVAFWLAPLTAAVLAAWTHEGMKASMRPAALRPKQD